MRHEMIIISRIQGAAEYILVLKFYQVTSLSMYSTTRSYVVNENALSVCLAKHGAHSAVAHNVLLRKHSYGVLHRSLRSRRTEPQKQRHRDWRRQRHILRLHCPSAYTSSLHTHPVKPQPFLQGHANFQEYVPLFLILLGLLEMQDVLPSTGLHGLASVFAVGRALHALHFSWRGPFLCRQIGMMMTVIGLAIESFTLMKHALS